MSASEKISLAILAIIFAAAVVKAVLWATEPRQTLLDEYYSDLERGEK